MLLSLTGVVILIWAKWTKFWMQAETRNWESINFSKVAQITVERVMTISVFRWNSCGLSKCLNGHQSQTLKTSLHRTNKDTDAYTTRQGLCLYDGCNLTSTPATRNVPEIHHSLIPLAPDPIICWKLQLQVRQVGFGQPTVLTIQRLKTHRIFSLRSGLRHHQ